MATEPIGALLLTYGPLGVFVVLFAFGFVFSKSSMERERTLTDRLVDNNGKMAEALDRVTDAVLRDRVGG